MIVAAILLGFSMAMAPADEGPKGVGGRMRIELDAYSGRENPAWSPSEPQVGEFAKAFEALEVDDAETPIRDGLGYRGFKVAGFRDYERLTVGFGVVRATRGGKTIRWRDKGRALERLLLKSSRAHVDEPAYRYAASMIEPD